MSFFNKDSDLNRRTDSKSRNKNAELYAQALAAKFRLGLLDARECSALETLCSYDNPINTLDKKRNSNPNSSQLPTNSFQQTPGHDPSFHDELKDSYPYERTGTSRNLNPDQPAFFKPIVSLDSIDDEDAFLYGDSNPLPDENSPFQNETTNKMASNDACCNDHLLDVEIPGLDKCQKSLSFFESGGAEKYGLKLSISTFKQLLTRNHNHNAEADNSSAWLDPSLRSKQYKVAFEAHSNSASAIADESYKPNSLLHHNLDNHQRPRTSSETAKKNSNISGLESPALKITDSSMNPSASVKDNSKNNEVAIQLLRKPDKKQFNPEKSAKNKTHCEEFYSKYEELHQEEVQVIYDSENRSPDKSLTNEPLKSTKLLINAQKGDSCPPRKVVQVQASDLSSCKNNANIDHLESSLNSIHNLNKSGLLEVDESVHKHDDLKTRRAVREKTFVNRELVTDSSKEEARVLPKRYIEKDPKKVNETHMKQRDGEKLPKNYSDKETHFEYGSKSKSHPLRSPEKRWSSSYNTRHSSPSNSPRRGSPEYYRRRSPSYSPPNFHSRNRSPISRNRALSESYRSRNDRRRSPERSSRRDRRSHEQSPQRESRYRSHDRSQRWKVAEKESRFPKDDIPTASLESKRKERSLTKRKQNYSSEEFSDDEQWSLVTELADKFKRKESTVILNESENLKSAAISSKKSKMSIPDENREEILLKSQRPDTVTKIKVGLEITKNTSVPFQQNEKVSEIIPDSSSSKDTGPETINPLLKKLGIPSLQISSSTSTITTTLAPTTSWTAVSTVTPAPVSSVPHQLSASNGQEYVINYPQQFTSTVPHMYPQFMYGPSSVPTLSSTQYPYYNPMYPQHMYSTPAFEYSPSPVPPNDNASGFENFQINTNPSNPTSHDQIRYLKPIPVVNSALNSNSDMPQPCPARNQHNPSTRTKQKMYGASNTLIEVTPSENPDLETISTISKQSTVERYKMLLEEKETLQKKAKNTFTHFAEISNLKADLEKKAKLSNIPNIKQLNTQCSNLYKRTMEELNIYYDREKKVTRLVKELQAKIKPETLKKLAKEVPDKKSELSSVRYAGYDMGGHWCEFCNVRFPKIPQVIEHLHSEIHRKYVNPLKVILESPKENIEKHSKRWPIKGVEFIKPLYSFYCSLCSEALPNQSSVEYHLKGSHHIEKYMTFLKENPVYERKRGIFKEAADVVQVYEKSPNDFEEIYLGNQTDQDKQFHEINSKKLEVLTEIQDKQRQLKKNDKESEKLKESNMNARNSPRTQKAGIKLTLENKKRKAIEPLKPSVTKRPDVKPKVVYIGRAPNYKPRPKGVETENPIASENKNTCLNTNTFTKDEVGKESLSELSSNDESNAPDFTLSEDDKAKTSENKLPGSTQNSCKDRTTSPNGNKNVPSSEIEAKEFENAKCDSHKQSIKSSERPTAISKINQFLPNSYVNEKNGVMHMERDNDPVCSEVEVGSGITYIKKELSVSSESVLEEPSPSTFSTDELNAKCRVQQISDSELIIKKNGGRLIQKSLLSYFKDSVADSILGKNSEDSSSENLLLTSKETSRSNDKSANHKLNLCSSSVEQSVVSLPQSENIKEYCSLEKNADGQMKDKTTIISSKTCVQFDKECKMCSDYSLIENMQQNNITKISPEVEFGNIKDTLMVKLTSNMTDVKMIENSVTNSFEQIPNECLKQRDNIPLSATTEIDTTRTNDSEKAIENKTNLSSLTTNPIKCNDTYCLTNSSSSKSASNNTENISEQKENIEFSRDHLHKIQCTDDNLKIPQIIEINENINNNKERNLEVIFDRKEGNNIDDSTSKVGYCVPSTEKTLSFSDRPAKEEPTSSFLSGGAKPSVLGETEMKEKTSSGETLMDRTSALWETVMEEPAPSSLSAGVLNETD